jgi:hypothetical protein
MGKKPAAIISIAIEILSSCDRQERVGILRRFSQSHVDPLCSSVCASAPQPCLPGRAFNKPKFCPHGKLGFRSCLIIILIKIVSRRLFKKAGIEIGRVSLVSS